MLNKALLILLTAVFVFYLGTQWTLFVVSQSCERHNVYTDQSLVIRCEVTRFN